MDENEQRAALESVRKDANDPTLSVGDTVFCGGIYATVTDIQVWGPGQHGNSPIRNDWTAVQVTTDTSDSRWHGREPQSGYTPCACRDCMDDTMSSDMTKPELCSECSDAGCEPCMWIVLHPGDECSVGRLHECQRAARIDGEA